MHATRLDAAASAVQLDDGTTIRADGIVVATGARARSWPGSERLAGVHVLRTVDDAVALRDELRAGARLVVIGAGFIGAEVASTAAKLGLDVTVVEAALAPLAGPLGVQLGAAVARLHTEHGTRLLCGAPVAGLTGGDRVTGVVLADGRRLAADVVVVGIGAIPNIEWLRDSPLELANGVVCDEGGATSIPNVVAVGDCAAWHEPSVGWPHRVEHWTGALERPAIAVATLLAGGRHHGTPAKPPYFWSDQYGRRIQFAGIADPGDEITFEVGSAARRQLPGRVSPRGQPVAVLGVDQPRLFTRWRRQLASSPSPPDFVSRRGDPDDHRRPAGEPYLDAARQLLHRRHHLRDGTGGDLRVDVVLRRAGRRPRQAGSVQDRQVGRESVLITRSRSGEVRAFFNVCRHRGAQLCTEESGEVKRAFQCPYHAWTYDLDGKLVAAPNLTKMPDIDRVEYGLRRIAVREWLGYVWVCLADTPPSFDDTVRKDVSDRLGNVEFIDHYDTAILRVGRRIRYDVKANWKLIIENFMECYHCATIHPELTEVLPEFADGLAVQYHVGHGAEFGEDIEGFTIDGSAGLDHIPSVAAGPGPALLRDHGQAAGVRQPGARPCDPAPDVSARRGPHGRRM